METTATITNGKKKVKKQDIDEPVVANPEEFQTELQKAVEFAFTAHLGQFRKGNCLPYIVHPLAVLSMVRDWGVVDIVACKAAVCHDILEDNEKIEPRQLAEVIGRESTAIVEELTFRPDLTSPMSPAQQKAEYMKTFMVKSLPALVIKFADRVCNTHDFFNFDQNYAATYWRKAEPLIEAVLSRGELMLEPFGPGVFPRMKYARDQLSRLLVR